MADMEARLAMDRDPEVTRFIIGPWADPVAHRAFVAARIHAAYPTGMGQEHALDRGPGSDGDSPHPQNKSPTM
jgi:hypothetical protein